MKSTTLSRKKLVVFGVVAVMLSTALVLGALLGLDLYLHKKFGKVAGLNIWGYRGPVVGRKASGERRIVVLGGSTAFGYGVGPSNSFPALLERKLNAGAAGATRPISVVNLGGNNEGAHSFQYTLRYFVYLDYDAALLYEGYNDLALNTGKGFRGDSAIFRLTGYFPITPTIFAEKAMAIRYGGNLEAAYRGEKTVFRPNLAERVTATALETAAGVSRSLERQLGRLSVESALSVPAAGGCEDRWAFYCESVHAAITYLRERGRVAVVVTQPYINEAHVDQQAALVAMLKERFGQDPKVVHVNLGRALDIKNSNIAYDGMHLTPPGNGVIAARLVEPVRAVFQ